MKQLASVRFGAQTAEEIVAFLAKSGNGVQSAKIEQGIAIAILDGKRPANSGTLKKYVLAKAGGVITPHAFCVAVAFAALNGEGVGFVPEEKFVAVPLNWHLQASPIINLVANPKSGLDDAGRAAVHEEVAEIFRAKPDKGEELLKLIKARFKQPGDKSGEGGKKEGGESEAPAPLSEIAKVEMFVDFLANDGLKKIGMIAMQLGDLQQVQQVQRAYALMASLDLPAIAARNEAVMPGILAAIAEQIGNLTAPAANAAAEAPAEAIAA